MLIESHSYLSICVRDTRSPNSKPTREAVSFFMRVKPVNKRGLQSLAAFASGKKFLKRKTVLCAKGSFFFSLVVTVFRLMMDTVPAFVGLVCGSIFDLVTVF